MTQTMPSFSMQTALSLVFNLVCPLILLAQTPGSTAPALAGAAAETEQAVSLSGDELNWPRTYADNNVTIAIYQPQIERWEGQALESRSVVAITFSGASRPVYGVFWMTARANVDKAAGIVTLRDIQLTKARFPTAPGKQAAYLDLLRPHVSTAVQTVALDHLQASYAISEAVRKARAIPVRNEPPRIIHTTAPALLVLVDGAPVLRPIPPFQMLNRSSIPPRSSCAPVASTTCSLRTTGSRPMPLKGPGVWSTAFRRCSRRQSKPLSPPMPWT